MNGLSVAAVAAPVTTTMASSAMSAVMAAPIIIGIAETEVNRRRGIDGIGRNIYRNRLRGWRRRRLGNEGIIDNNIPAVRVADLSLDPE